MIPEVSRNCMFLSFSREIWDVLHQTFYTKQVIATCYELKTKIFSTKHGTIPVIDYYATLTGLWIELDK